MPADDLTTIRALTICEPWAWAVMTGLKRFENRDWQTEYVGPLVIHAGKSEKRLKEGLAFLRALKIDPPACLEFGAILGLVDMVDCVRPAETRDAAGKVDPFATGPYCHAYANPRRLAVPIPYVGRQGFFRVPRELVADLLDPLPTPAATQETRAARLERALTVGAGALRPADLLRWPSSLLAVRQDDHYL